MIDVDAVITLSTEADYKGISPYLNIDNKLVKKDMYQSDYWRFNEVTSQLTDKQSMYLMNSYIV